MQRRASASVNGAHGLPSERPGRPYNVHMPLPSTGLTELALAHAGLAQLIKSAGKSPFRLRVCYK